MNEIIFIKSDCLNEWRNTSMRSHKKPPCPKCRADIGEFYLARFFPEVILHLKKALRLEKIKVNFLKKTDQTSLEETRNDRSSEQ